MDYKESYVFDSFALLKLFQKEPGCEKIVELLRHIKSHNLKKYINAVNLGEIIYITKREFGEQYKLEVLAGIERLEFIILSAPNELIYKAAEYKAQYAVSCADCFVLASAMAHDAAIVTGDPEFKKVKALAKIVWV
jgi:ribonuclease VapC